MLKITMSHNGKSIAPDDFIAKIKRDTFNSVVKNHTDRLKDVRCPEHGSAPHVKVTPTTGMSFELSIIDSCCKKLDEACAERLRD
jgi:hypothetical protein